MQYTNGPVAKPFTWSYSKLKNYRTCPRRYRDIDHLKKYQEDFSGEALAWGGQVHTAFEQRIGKGIPFAHGMEGFEDAAARLLAVPGQIMVEQKMAITKDLKPTTYFAKDVWYRGIADYLNVGTKVALAIDYKTGKIIEDSEQLALLAECVFSHYPHIEAVRTEFWWLKDDAATRVDFRRTQRKETWSKILPEVMQLEQAHQTNTFPEKPSGLCKRFCIVKDCPHNGQFGK